MNRASNSFNVPNVIEHFRSPEEVAQEHAEAAWGRGELWKCQCPHCQIVRDLPRIPAVAPEDDSTW
jgi:hypothetical protein